MLPWTNKRFAGAKRAAHAARKAGQANKTEAAYEQAVLLPALRAGELAGYWFESLTLVLSPGNACRYTPDYLVQRADGVLELHEVKGSKRDKLSGRAVPVVEEDALVKLKAAAAMYPFAVRMVWPEDRAMQQWSCRKYTREEEGEV